MPRDLPIGQVSLLFTDVEGSTLLLHERGAAAYAEALGEHRLLMREAFVRHGGVEVDTQGDAFFVAFASATNAVNAAVAAQRALEPGPIRVRMGIHTGTPHVTDEGYVGEDVHLGARIAAAGHGGQVLISKATRELIEADVTDLGEHRLKDFSEPVALFQLGAVRYPPLKTISNTNLPRPASSFLGRAREVAEVTALIREGNRLLTLTGPGGSGKTRLAIETAAELVGEFKAGAFWVGLATIRDPALVPETIARTIGARGTLASWIGDRELLLLLDNLEQVIAAAPALAELVETCPNLTLMVTSRELLRVRGEVDYPVLPLGDAEAVALFTTRAKLTHDDTVAELCRHLDNLPLALELAAARAAVLTPAQILGRLSTRLDLFKGGRDADPRQQTLRATIAWSYDLLDADEKRLFERLAVFRGGCTLDAAEAVADANLDVLQSLVDKNLIRRNGNRFWMLETIREYADEQSGAAELIDRCARYYLDLAENAYPNLKGDPKQWLDRLEAEHDNLRAALDHLQANRDQGALELAGAIYRFWYMRGHLREGRNYLEQLLALNEQPTAARARALAGAAVMALNTGDYQAARIRSEQAIALHRKLGDLWGATYTEFLLAMTTAEEGDYAAAAPLMAQSMRQFRELGDEHYSQVAGANLGYFYQELGELDRARDVLTEVADEARAVGNERNLASSLGQLATVAGMQGKPDESFDLLRRSLPIWTQLGDLAMAARDLRRLARALAETGRAEAAARTLAASETIRKESGQWEGWIARVNDEILGLIHADLDHDAFERAWASGRGLSIEGALELAPGSRPP